MEQNTKKIILTDKTNITEYTDMGLTNTLIIQFADKYLPIFRRVESMLKSTWEDMTSESERRIKINKGEYVLECNQRIFKKISKMNKEEIKKKDRCDFCGKLLPKEEIVCSLLWAYCSAECEIKHKREIGIT